MGTSPTLIQHFLEIPSQSNKIGRRNKKNTNRKGRSQTILIWRSHYLISKRPEKLHQKILHIINTFSKYNLQNQFTKNQ
jgi:hypothetical protein